MTCSMKTPLQEYLMASPTGSIWALCQSMGGVATIRRFVRKTLIGTSGLERPMKYKRDNRYLCY